MDTTAEIKMPDTESIYKRLSAIESKVERVPLIENKLDKIHDILATLAMQQKDIDRIQKDLDDLKSDYDTRVETRIKSLEIIHAGCQIGRIEKQLKAMWVFVSGITMLFLGTAIGWFYSK